MKFVYFKIKMKIDDLNLIYYFLIKFVLKQVCMYMYKYMYVNLYICELGWKYSKGFVSDEMIKYYFFSFSSDTVILMCGFLFMINFVCQFNFDKFGYSQKFRFVY